MISTTAIVKEEGNGLDQTGATLYHAQLGLPSKNYAIK